VRTAQPYARRPLASNLKYRYSTDGRWRVPHFEKMLYDHGRAVAWDVGGSADRSARLSGILTRSKFCGFLRSEFFNSHLVV